MNLRHLLVKLVRRVSPVQAYWIADGAARPEDRKLCNIAIWQEKMEAERGAA